jgi:charged multivesicular body protein 7
VLNTHVPSRLSFSINDKLAKELESEEWHRPLGLGAVVSDALAKREWIPYKDFLDSKESIYYKRWVRIPGVGEVLQWGLRQLGFFSSSGTTSGRVVVLENLEMAGKEVIKRYEVGPKGRVERIYSRQAWKETFGAVLGGKEMADSDVEVLLRFLGRDKGVLVYNSSTVKFLAGNEAQSLTQEDETIASLKSLIESLEIQVKKLDVKVEKLGNTAKEAVQRKNRLGALSALRSKKLAESTLGKRQATLAQLEEVFMKIEQATDQVELVRVMEASSRVLGSLNKEIGGVERVEGVMDKLREEMERTDEVGQVVGELGKEGVDEGEVDDELEVMEREERERREAVERAEQEKREKKEAEETRKRLDALEAVEREAREKENARKQVEAEATTEKEIEDSTMGMKRMSLDPPDAEMA